MSVDVGVHHISMPHIWSCFLFLVCPCFCGSTFYFVSLGDSFYFCLHALLSAEDEGKPKREPESSPNTSVEEAGAAKPESKEKDGGTALKRAYSLSDLNKPNVPRRLLPAPPSNGNVILDTTKSNLRRMGLAPDNIATI